jgi:hypothetical protein
MTPIKVKTPSPQEFVAWVLEQGQFCPNSGKELLQAAVIIQELLQAATITQKLQRIASFLQNPHHPMHGLDAGLVQTTSTTTPENVMTTDDFVFFTLNQSGERLAIRKSSISAFYGAQSKETILEYDGDSAFVRESFDEVCAKLGIAAPQQEPQP